jgi:hypothetical protein
VAQKWRVGGPGLHSLPTVMGRGKDPVCYQCIPAPIDAPN